MFCSHCGKELLDGVRFCSNCGQPVLSQAQTQELLVQQKLQKQTAQQQMQLRQTKTASPHQNTAVKQMPSVVSKKTRAWILAAVALSLIEQALQFVPMLEVEFFSEKRTYSVLTFLFKGEDILDYVSAQDPDILIHEDLIAFLRALILCLMAIVFFFCIYLVLQLFFRAVFRPWMFLPMIVAMGLSSLLQIGILGYLFLNVHDYWNRITLDLAALGVVFVIFAMITPFFVGTAMREACGMSVEKAVK